MDGQYLELIGSASELLAKGMLDDVEALIEAGPDLDGACLEILRAVGRQVMELLHTRLSVIMLERIASPDLPVERRPKVPFKTIFGEVRVESPYLRNRTTSESRRPMLELFGVEGQCYSRRVDRAMAAFGCEESFSKAAMSFEEHYGWSIGRTTILRRTRDIADDAVEFLEERFGTAQAEYEKPLVERPGVEEILVELDGCEIRTGVLQPASAPGEKRTRKEKWREVRTGLARPLAEVDATYVCAMAGYPDICNDLFAAACVRGLSEKTTVVGVADGGIGLMEALDETLPNLQFILDRPHLKSHLFETAEALGMESALRPRWVTTWLDRLHAGEVDQVLKELRALQLEIDNDRLRRFIEYLDRFSHAVAYDDFEAAGWPCGSGEVEAAHRVVPQPRLKIVGA